MASIRLTPSKILRVLRLKKISTNGVGVFFLPFGKFAFWGSSEICNSWHYQLAHVPTEKLQLSSHIFIRALSGDSALSHPPATMRLLAPLFASALLVAFALASTAAAQVRIGKWDSGEEFSRGESGFSRALHFSAFFSFTRHEAISGLIQGRKLWR